MSLVPTLQISVQGQVQQQRSPPTPGTIAPPSITPAPPPPQSLGAAGGSGSQTEGGAGAANQSGMVMIPLSTMQMIMSQVQHAMTAVGSDNKADALTTLNSVEQELESAVDATGVS